MSADRQPDPVAASRRRFRVPAVFRQAWIAAVSPVVLVSTWWLEPDHHGTVMASVYAGGAVLVLLSIGARLGR